MRKSINNYIKIPFMSFLKVIEGTKALTVLPVQKLLYSSGMSISTNANGDVWENAPHFR